MFDGMQVTQPMMHYTTCVMQCWCPQCRRSHLVLVNLKSGQFSNVAEPVAVDIVLSMTGLLTGGKHVMQPYFVGLVTHSGACRMGGKGHGCLLANIS